MVDDFIKKISKLPQHIIYGGVILIVGLAFVGTYGYFRNQELERKKQEFLIQEQKGRVEREQEKTNKASLETCLDNAYKAQQEFWDKEVKRAGNQKDNTLPEYNANIVNEYLKDQREMFEHFPFGLAWHHIKPGHRIQLGT